jgi:Protein of unknown function (DUF3619)
MNERELGAKWKRDLDRSLEDLSPRVLKRLQSARETAVERSRQAVAAHGFTWSAAGARLLGDPTRRLGARYWLPLAALIAGLAVIYYWQVASVPQESEELELLAGELPLNAYLDQGFDQWLSDSSRQ